MGRLSFLLNLKGLVSQGVETANPLRNSLSMDPERSKRNLREGEVGKENNLTKNAAEIFHRVFFSSCGWMDFCRSDGFCLDGFLFL